MTYRAYIAFGNNAPAPQLVGEHFPVFPRSRKTPGFKTIDAASKMLERKIKMLNYDTRGLVYDEAGILVYTIAL